MIYCKTKSLIVPIASHGIFNALSVFAVMDGATQKAQIFSAVLLTFLTGGYATYIALSMKNTNSQVSSECEWKEK